MIIIIIVAYSFIYYLILVTSSHITYNSELLIINTCYWKPIDIDILTLNIYRHRSTPSLRFCILFSPLSQIFTPRFGLEKFFKKNSKSFFLSNFTFKNKFLFRLSAVLVSPTYFSWIPVEYNWFHWNPLEYTYVWIFFIFIYYILGTFQVIPVDSSTVLLKIATIFILDIICQHIRFWDTLLWEVLDMIFM